MLAGPPPGLPPDRGLVFELHIDTGLHPIAIDEAVVAGELDEYHKQHFYSTKAGSSPPVPLMQPWQCSRGWGTWRFCQNYRGLNAITQKSVEPLPHVDQLIDETRAGGARFFTKLDLAMAYMQFRIRSEDQHKISFRVPGGQYEFRVGAFGLHFTSAVPPDPPWSSTLPACTCMTPACQASLPSLCWILFAGVLRRCPRFFQDPRGAFGASMKEPIFFLANVFLFQVKL